MLLMLSALALLMSFGTVFFFPPPFARDVIVLILAMRCSSFPVEFSLQCDKMSHQIMSRQRRPSVGPGYGFHTAYNPDS